MPPFRAKMMRAMALQRLARRPQEASSAAVAGLAKFYGRSPDQLPPDQMRASVHHLLVERHRAWSSCNQVACGRTFFYVTTLGWEALSLTLPPRTGRWRLPHLMRVEELQRLFTRAATPRNRAVLMPPYAAGLRVGEVVRLHRSDLERDRLLIRVNQGKGRKDRYPLLLARLRTELRTDWPLYRPVRWLCTGPDRPQPLSSATAQKISYPAKRSAGITHGTGIHPLRHCCATPLWEAGGELHTIQLLLGPRTIATTTRYLPLTRRPRAKVHSPFDLRGVAEGLPSVTTE